MKNVSRAILILLPLLSACAGGTNSTLPPLQSAAAGQSASVLASSLAPVTREPVEELRLPQAVASTGDLLYVGNTGSNTITVYRNDAAGNVAPMYVIGGPRTGIDHPGQLAQDAQGNLYVANGAYSAAGQSSSAPAILVFAHGANGDVAPIRTLAGSLTGIHNIAAMTVDRATGKIFVDDYVYESDGYLVDVRMLRFPPGATGNTAPYARSAAGLFPALELASDSTGQRLIEAHSTNAANNYGFGVDTIVKQFPNGGAAVVPPYGVIDAFQTTGVADDPTTKTYLVSAGGIYRFAEGTTGVGATEGNVPSFTPLAESTITSDTCGSQLAIGNSRDIFVTHGTQMGCPADAIYVYAPDAAGNAHPLRILAGAATGLSHPYGIFVGT